MGVIKVTYENDFSEVLVGENKVEKDEWVCSPAQLLKYPTCSCTKGRIHKSIKRWTEYDYQAFPAKIEFGNGKTNYYENEEPHHPTEKAIQKVFFEGEEIGYYWRGNKVTKKKLAELAKPLRVV